MELPCQFLQKRTVLQKAKELFYKKQKQKATKPFYKRQNNRSTKGKRTVL